MSLRAAVWAAVLLVACKSPSKPAAAGSDAGIEAGTDAAASSSAAGLDGATPKERDRTLVPVGEGMSEVRLFPTLDGRVVVVAGSTAYEGKPNGVLEPLVPVAASAPLYPDDDKLVGFLEPSLNVLSVRGEVAGPGPLLVDGVTRKRTALAVREGKLIPATPIDAQHVVRWRGKLIGANGTSGSNTIAWVDGTSEPAPVAPASIPTVHAMAVDRDGALVLLRLGGHQPPRAAIYAATWKPGDAPVVVEGPKMTNCSLVPSFDASVVVHCWDPLPNARDTVRYFRVSSAGFERVFANAPDGTITKASIGRDGALYVAFAKRIAVERCPAPASACTPLPIVEELGTIGTAHYQPVVTDVYDRVGTDDIGDRAWTTLRVESAPEKPVMGGVISILARDENDVWITVGNTSRSYVLHATNDRTRERVRLPSVLDGRILVENTSPPQAWTGHCEQVFIRLGTRDADKIKARAGDIEKALGSPPESYEHAFQWWLVEGRLHESHAIGVVVVRRDAEESLDKMERAVEKLIAAFSENPMSKPPAYCTLPVLERRLHPGGS